MLLNFNEPTHRPCLGNRRKENQNNSQRSSICFYISTLFWRDCKVEIMVTGEGSKHSKACLNSQRNIYKHINNRWCFFHTSVRKTCFVFGFSCLMQRWKSVRLVSTYWFVVVLEAAITHDCHQFIGPVQSTSTKPPQHQTTYGYIMIYRSKTSAPNQHSTQTRTITSWCTCLKH